MKTYTHEIGGKSVELLLPEEPYELKWQDVDAVRAARASFNMPLKPPLNVVDEFQRMAKAISHVNGWTMNHAETECMERVRQCFVEQSKGSVGEYWCLADNPERDDDDDALPRYNLPELADLDSAYYALPLASHVGQQCKVLIDALCITFVARGEDAGEAQRCRSTMDILYFG